MKFMQEVKVRLGLPLLVASLYGFYLPTLGVSQEDSLASAIGIFLAALVFVQLCWEHCAIFFKSIPTQSADEADATIPEEE